MNLVFLQMNIQVGRLNKMLMITQTLDNYIEVLIHKGPEITAARKKILNSLVEYISEKTNSGLPVNLLFICTHNSRRSHLAQIWAQVAACYTKVPMIKCYSGGTEVTAFNSSAIAALERSGMKIQLQTPGANPVYQIFYAETEAPIIAFSKTYFAPGNPRAEFAAVMTCSDADLACPHVAGAESRFPLNYNDPKIADGTPQEAAVYDQRCREIGTEMFYVFERVASIGAGAF